LLLVLVLATVLFVLGQNRASTIVSFGGTAVVMWGNTIYISILRSRRK
jgi:hypothetical protein